MANTFTQIYIQVVFAVRNRESMIDPKWEEDLYKYITGIVQNKGQKMLAINGIPNHIHFLIGMKPTCCLSDLVREVKKSSGDYVNEMKFTKQQFRWQEGFGGFLYSHSALGNVIGYVMNQKEHHRNRSFKKEYLDILAEFQIEFNFDYLFKWID